jgi:large subunit ribosomal protein L17
MRHQRAGRKLKRTASHRKATLSALCSALIVHKKIKTTVAKAKETRMFVEKIITKAKNAVSKETSSGTKHVAARRDVFATLRSKAAVTSLFSEIAPKVASRPGGYTRVVKLGRRLGDGAEIAILELVDFNVGQEKAATKSAKKSAPRSKRGAKQKKDAEVKSAENTPTSDVGATPTTGVS